MSAPLVSVVTPFHNTAQFLPQCIESVLAQSWAAFEYILVDNYSSDGSGEIAESYARRDSRIRVLHRTALLSQVQNYNLALEEISPESRYCKLVQADDYLFPESLERMVALMEESPSVGLVSSYWLKGAVVRGSGFPVDVSILPGPEMGRRFLRTGIWVFGSPTAVLYRSCMVREQRPFYDEARLHEDTEKCLQILTQWDFGFVHQVLSFSRADNESISTAVRNYQPEALDRYILVKHWAPAFLDGPEAAALRRRSRRDYYNLLAAEALRLRQPAFWRYHREGLKTTGERLSIAHLTARAAGRIVSMIVNPGSTLTRAGRFSLRLLRPRKKAPAR